MNWLRTNGRWLLPVAGGAALVQVAYLIEGSHDPSFLHPIVDARVYHQQAVRFAMGEALEPRAFWQPPFFSLALGCLYRLVGPSIIAAKVALAALAVGSCLFVSLIGRRLYSPAVGTVAGLMLATYGPFLFFSTQLLATGPAIFLQLLALVLLLRAMDRPTTWRWLVVGLVVGIATITVPNSVMVLPVGLILILGRAPRRGRGRACRCAVAAVAGWALAVAPVTVRNYLVSGAFVPIATNGGINLFVGNNADADRTIAIRPGEYWVRFVRSAMVSGAESPTDREAAFIRRIWAYAKDNPADYIGGLWRKAVRLVNAREIPRNVDVYVHRDYSSLLSALIWRGGGFAFPFGVLAPLAVVGAVAAPGFGFATRRTVRYRAALVAYCLLYGASVVAFFVTSRYRLPMACVMTVPAAAAVVWTLGWLTRRGTRRSVTRIGTSLALCAVVVVAVNRSLRTPTDDVNFRAELFMGVGHALMEEGDFEKAERFFGKSLEQDPEYAVAHARLGDLAARRHRFVEAESFYEAALRNDPGSSETRWLLAAVLAWQQRHDEAIDLYRASLELEPFDDRAHVGLADSLRARGDLDGAIEHYEFADEMRAQPGEVLFRLGAALAMRQRYADAIERYRRGVAKTNPDAEALRRFILLLTACPQAELRDCDEAILLCERQCVRTDAREPVCLETYSMALAACGRVADAITVAEQGLRAAEARADDALIAAMRQRLDQYRKTPPGG
ncbi:MAG: tetratricopeptide repeat protein [Planctomycetes bacterium]|nr:tetratricopeptide repeat protein [Planctomycetota bacterium]